MAGAASGSVAALGGAPPAALPIFRDSVWRAPLVPVALAFSFGVLLDQLVSVPLTGSLFAAAIMLAAWTAALTGRSQGLPLIYLHLAIVAVGVIYHHYRRDFLPPDEISQLAGETPRRVQLRGLLNEEPVRRAYADDPLRPPRRRDSPPERTTAVLTVTEYRGRGGWLPASGKVQVHAEGRLRELHAGDRVEAAGLLRAPHRPANPGERDYAAELRNQGIRAMLYVPHESGAVTRLDPAGLWSAGAWRARVRGWGTKTLREALPERQSGLAAALLLGDGAALDRSEWGKYIRTGVIHVLVVSGQHLVILAVFFWACLRLGHVRRRHGVLAVVTLLWAYALVAGLRPSVVRAAATGTVFGLGALVYRPVFTANALALAWLVVLFLNPTDINNTGCLLSFLCVAGLYWNQGRGQAGREKPDPLERLLEESRPPWQRWLLGLGRLVLAQYLLTLGLWLVITPLVAARLHFVPVACLVIGPPVIWLTSLALIAGFLFLLLSLVPGPLALPFALVTRWALAGCDWLVGVSDGVWARHGWVADVPGWWLWGFYLMLALGLLLERSRRHPRLVLLIGLAWLCLGLLAASVPRGPRDELRLTFLSVGHGGCVVLATPDGRTLLYDAGSFWRPEVGRQVIAPYLWSRGVRRIDEIILSHADRDHFNGLRGLLERFSVGQITCTPTFAARNDPGVRYILQVIQEHRVPVRTVWQGHRLTAGEVVLEVLHPPEKGPPGKENARSMVLLVRHGRQRILLTGDLEREGLERFLKLPPQVDVQADVLMAPHHGSRRLSTRKGLGVAELMDRVRPPVVVACQARPRSARPPNPYEEAGARFLATWQHGAITVRSHASGLQVETFLTKERFVVRPESRNR